MLGIMASMCDEGHLDPDLFDVLLTSGVYQEYADQRSRNEPLVEITQAKGTSDTHPALSKNDEWADFEIFPMRTSTRIPSEPRTHPLACNSDGFVWPFVPRRLIPCSVSYTI